MPMVKKQSTTILKCLLLVIAVGTISVHKNDMFCSGREHPWKFTNAICKN